MDDVNNFFSGHWFDLVKILVSSGLIALVWALTAEPRFHLWFGLVKPRWRRFRGRPAHFHVMVAVLNGGGGREQGEAIATLLRELSRNLMVVHYPFVLAVGNGVVAEEEAEAEKTGRKWLRRYRADLLIWGNYEGVGKKARLRFLAAHPKGRQESEIVKPFTYKPESSESFPAEAGHRLILAALEALEPAEVWPRDWTPPPEPAPAGEAVPEPPPARPEKRRAALAAACAKAELFLDGATVAPEDARALRRATADARHAIGWEAADVRDINRAITHYRALLADPASDPAVSAAIEQSLATALVTSVDWNVRPRGHPEGAEALTLIHRVLAADPADPGRRRWAGEELWRSRRGVNVGDSAARKLWRDHHRDDDPRWLQLWFRTAPEPPAEAESEPAQHWRDRHIIEALVADLAARSSRESPLAWAAAALVLARRRVSFGLEHDDLDQLNEAIAAAERVRDRIAPARCPRLRLEADFIRSDALDEKARHIASGSTGLELWKSALRIAGAARAVTSLERNPNYWGWLGYRMQGVALGLAQQMRDSDRCRHAIGLGRELAEAFGAPTVLGASTRDVLLKSFTLLAELSGGREGVAEAEPLSLALEAAFSPDEHPYNWAVARNSRAAHLLTLATLSEVDDVRLEEIKALLRETQAHCRRHRFPGPANFAQHLLNQADLLLAQRREVRYPAALEPVAAEVIARLSPSSGGYGSLTLSAPPPAPVPDEAGR